MKRKSTALLLAVLLIGVGVCMTVFRRPLTIAYHTWRMDAAYSTIFGDSEPFTDDIAVYDVTGIDVDAVLSNYQLHRTALVELGALSHVTAHFSHLGSDGSHSRLNVRTEFLKRMWVEFPGHKHYYLAPDGTFETWAPVAEQSKWEEFVEREAVPQ